MQDPSYIRSIRDGIKSGNIEANNIEVLQDGLVGYMMMNSFLKNGCIWGLKSPKMFYIWGL